MIAVITRETKQMPKKTPGRRVSPRTMSMKDMTPAQIKAAIHEVRERLADLEGLLLPLAKDGITTAFTVEGAMQIDSVLETLDKFHVNLGNAVTKARIAARAR